MSTNINENVDPEQGYNHAKFEKPRLNSVHGNANNKVCFLSNQETPQLSHLNTWKKKEKKGIFMTCLIYLIILQSLYLIG